MPPELVRFLPHDNHLDKIMVQKNATPSDGAQTTVEEACEDMGCRIPNMVVMERSSLNEVDVNAMTESALAHMAAGRGDEPAAPAGNHSCAPDQGQSGGVRFAREAWRDHVIALAANLLGDRENGRLRYTSRGAQCLADLGETTQRHNLVLMDEEGRGTWLEKMRLRLVVSPGTAMMSQFVPWFFGVAFPFRAQIRDRHAGYARMVIDGSASAWT